MRTVRDRPTLLQRFPNGVSGSNFFQKRIPDNAPDWLQTTIVSTPNGTTSRAIVMADIAHVLWAANLGCLGFHPWPYRASDPDNTDELRIDLDPSPGVTFPMVQEAAAEVRQFLDDNSITSFIKTTGNRGLHVYVRVEPGWDSFGTQASRRRRRQGARRSATRPDHREVVEGGARRPSVHRFQPERSAQDGVRRVVCASAPGCPGLHTVRLGGAAGDPSRRPDGPVRARCASLPTAIRGPTSTRSRSRSPRSSSATSATSPTASRTPRGRRCIRRCLTRRAASIRVAPATTRTPRRSPMTSATAT